MVAGEPQLNETLEAGDIRPLAFDRLSPGNARKISPGFVDRERMARKANLAVEIGVVEFEFPAGPVPAELPLARIIPNDLDPRLSDRKHANNRRRERCQFEARPERRPEEAECAGKQRDKEESA